MTSGVNFRNGPGMATIWSTDGYGPVRAASELGLAVRRTDTNEEELISTPRTDAFFTPWDWSPDGQSILLSSGPLPFVGTASLGLWPVAAAPHAETAVKVLAVDDNYAIWQGDFRPTAAGFVSRPSTPGRPALHRLRDPEWRCGSKPLDRSDRPQRWADKPRWSRDGKLSTSSRRIRFSMSGPSGSTPSQARPSACRFRSRVTTAPDTSCHRGSGPQKSVYRSIA